MAFQVSPGVLVQERDLTNIIPAVSTSVGAIAGQFSQGPLDEVVTISSEQELVSYFGKPNSVNFEDWFTAANFLQYSNALRVVRATNTGLLNATTNGSGILIKNAQDYQNNFSTGQGSVGTFASKTAGSYGNGILVATCPSATAYQTDEITAVNNAGTAVGDTAITLSSVSGINVGDILEFTSTASGTDYNGYKYKVTNINVNDVSFVRAETLTGGLHAPVTNSANVRRRWAYFDQVTGTPGTSPYVATRNGQNDEIHVVVVDVSGVISGTPNTILESYSKLSKASDAKTPQGDTNYYVDVLYGKSQYIYWMDHNPAGSNWGTAAAGTTYTAVTVPTSDTLSGGNDGSVVTEGQKYTAYQKFLDAETVDVGLIIAGSCTAEHVDNMITIAETRADSIAFVSPSRSSVVNVSNSNDQLTSVINFYSTVRSSSYVVFDTGYKYMYDRYSDVYRYVPLNGDIAGLAARTDLVADSWYSPAGLNRGNIRGAVKLAFNPTKTQRDDLYKARINPVVTFPGQGTVLFGDKTGLSAPSAFDRINVRRLFITLEKAISTASKFQLFEFNDEFTRANFRNIVEPFLREVQGRRGITDFKVICDETNNTGDVIDRNEFKADIYVKPARSINFITLTFIATRTGVSFSEVVS
jgi:hypothetical protein